MFIFSIINVVCALGQLYICKWLCSYKLNSHGYVICSLLFKMLSTIWPGHETSRTKFLWNRHHLVFAKTIVLMRDNGTPPAFSPEPLTRSFPLCFSVTPTCPQSMLNYLVLGTSIGSLAHGVPWLTGFSSLTTSPYASRVRHHCKLALLLFDGISSCARSAATRLPSASNRINIATYMCPSRWEVGERLFFFLWSYI